jgi:hypothetical protein
LSREEILGPYNQWHTIIYSYQLSLSQAFGVDALFSRQWVYQSLSQWHGSSSVTFHVRVYCTWCVDPPFHCNAIFPLQCQIQVFWLLQEPNTLRQLLPIILIRTCHSTAEVILEQNVDPG